MEVLSSNLHQSYISKLEPANDVCNYDPNEFSILAHNNCSSEMVKNYCKENVTPNIKQLNIGGTFTVPVENYLSNNIDTCQDVELGECEKSKDQFVPNLISGENTREGTKNGVIPELGHFSHIDNLQNLNVPAKNKIPINTDECKTNKLMKWETSFLDECVPNVDDQQITNNITPSLESGSVHYFKDRNKKLAEESNEGLVTSSQVVQSTFPSTAGSIAPKSVVSDSSKNRSVEKDKSRIVALLMRLPALDEFFTLHSKIGEGTFSSVFLATLKNVSEDSLFRDRKFAVKHLVPTTHPTRTERELKCLQDIGGHDNVVGVNLCLRNKDTVVFVMPYLPHRRFSDYVLDMGVSETREYLKNLLLALKRVHSFNVIHRDIKPSNFLYDRENKKFLLVDFGLAQNLNQSPESSRLEEKDKKHKREEEDKVEGSRSKRVALQPRTNVNQSWAGGQGVKNRSPVNVASGAKKRNPGKVTYGHGSKVRSPGKVTYGHGSKVRSPGKVTYGHGSKVRSPGKVAYGHGSKVRSPGKASYGSKNKTPSKAIYGPGSKIRLTPRRSIYGLGSRTRTPGKTSGAQGSRTRTPGKASPGQGSRTKTPLKSILGLRSRPRTTPGKAIMCRRGLNNGTPDKVNPGQQTPSKGHSSLVKPVSSRKRGFSVLEETSVHAPVSAKKLKVADVENTPPRKQRTPGRRNLFGAQGTHWSPGVSHSNGTIRKKLFEELLSPPGKGRATFGGAQSGNVQPKFQTLAPEGSRLSSTSYVRVQNSQVKSHMVSQSEFPRPVPSSAVRCSCYGKSQICNLCMVRRVQAAPRAGTPGFRPPEVLLKYPLQTTAVDMWAVGVILLCILSGCYPFFRSPDDVSALAEIMALYGSEKIKKIAVKLGRLVQCSQDKKPLDMRKLCERLRRRRKEGKTKSELDTAICPDCLQIIDKVDGCLCLSPGLASRRPVPPPGDDLTFPDSAYDLLERLMDLNPDTRITAVDALQHPFVNGL